MNPGSVSLLRTLSRDTTGCKAAAGNGVGRQLGKGRGDSWAMLGCLVFLGNGGWPGLSGHSVGKSDPC